MSLSDDAAARSLARVRWLGDRGCCDCGVVVLASEPGKRTVCSVSSEAASCETLQVSLPAGQGLLMPAGWTYPSDEIVREREALLMTELLGDEVKLRHIGYQTMIKAIVVVQDLGFLRDDREKTYRLLFQAASVDKFGVARGNQVRRIRRLDVKIDREWQTVWDDGADDLGPYKPLATSAKPCKERYNWSGTYRASPWIDLAPEPNFKGATDG